MKIHKEGYKIIANTTLIFSIVSIAAYLFTPLWAAIPLYAVSLFCVGFCFRFFRVPHRVLMEQDNQIIYSPADGTIVAIEEVFEDEYLNEKRLQVSVFMSIWNVHINWFPVGGAIEYFKHHHGDFVVAWHPKSSTDNERTTTVVDTGSDRILFRQIAGYVARRIVNYAEEHTGATFEQNTQCGFIKFGSRVDLFLPLDAKLNVKMGDKVTGTQTVIANLQKK